MEKPTFKLPTTVEGPNQRGTTTETLDGEMNRVLGVVYGDLEKRAPANAIQLLSLTGNGAQPLIMAGRKMLLWTDAQARLHGVGLSKRLRADAVRDIATSVRAGPVIPLILAGRKMLAWWDARRNKVQFAGLGEAATLAAVADLIAAKAQPRMAVRGSAPIATDGRTLFRTQAKLARLRRGVAVDLLRITLIGDSWIGQQRIVNALKRQFAARGLAPTATGFIPANASDRPTGTTFAVSANWTLANARQLQATPFGVGISGYVAYTQTPGEVLTYGGFTGDTLEIHRSQHGGRWSYALSGAPAVEVQDDTGGATGAIVLTGLPPGPHTLVITSISGTCSQLGLVASSAGGVRIDALGSSGTIAARTATWIDRGAEQARLLAPDLLITLFGTNDYASGLAGSDPTSHAGYLKQIVNVFRSNAPCGVICAVPARTDRVAVNPLSAYRDAVYGLALEDGGLEFFNAYDLFGPYADSNALGLMADSYHPNDDGGEMFVRGLDTHLLHLGA